MKAWEDDVADAVVTSPKQGRWHAMGHRVPRLGVTIIRGLRAGSRLGRTTPQPSLEGQSLRSSTHPWGSGRGRQAQVGQHIALEPHSLAPGLLAHAKVTWCLIHLSQAPLGHVHMHSKGDRL